MSVSLTSLGVAFTENFNSLASSGTSDVLPTGWYFSESGTAANTTYAAGSGSLNTGNTYSFGSDATDRAFGGLQSGSLIPTLGASFTNNTGSTITSLAITYYGEQWRLGTAGRSDRLDFQYSLNATSLTTGTWTDLDALDFTSPNTTAAVGALDGNLVGNRTEVTGSITSLAVADGQTIWIRWTDFNASGADDGLAVDNFSITANGAAAAPTIAIAPASVSQNEGTLVDTTFSHTITRSDTSADTSVQVTITGGAGFTGADITGVTVDGTPVSGFALGTPFTVNLTGSATTANLAVIVAGDIIDEADEAFTITLSAPSAGYALGNAVANDTVLDDDTPVPTTTHEIAEIQGTAHISSFVSAINTASSAIVTVNGIITARSSDGFYIQDDTPDDNRLTSDAIFVRTGSAPAAALTLGERVIVTGKVFEFQNFNNLPFTQLVGQTSSGGTAANVPLSDIYQFNDSNALPSVRVGGAGGVTPALRSINGDDFNGGLANSFNVDTNGNPVDGTDFWETLESVRVIYSDPVISDGFWYSFNGVYVHSESIGATLPNSRGGLTISGGPGYDPAVGVAGGGASVIHGDQNPERIQLDFSNTALSTGGFGTLNVEADMGDRLNDVTGIVRMDFTNWKLFVTETPSFKPGGNQVNGPAPEVTTLSADSRALKVAAYNVENLSLFTNNTQSQANFDAGIQKFRNIAQMLDGNAGAPDVILVSEVQDNNGATNDAITDASINWTALTQALRNQTGRDYVWVDQAPLDDTSGGAPGANIRTGIIYDKQKVQLGNGTFVEPGWTSYDGATAADLLTAAAANLTAANARRAWTDSIGDGLRDAGDQITISDNMLGGEIVTADWSATRLSLMGEFTFNGQKLFLTSNHWPSKGGSGAQYLFNPVDITADGANASWQKRKNIAQDMWSMVEYARINVPGANFVVGGDLNEYWFFDPLRVMEGRIDQNGLARAAGGATLVNMGTTLPEAERFGYTFDGNSQTLDHILVSSALAPHTVYDSVHLNTGYNSNRVLPAERIYGLSDHDPSLIVTDFRPFAERLIAAVAGSSIAGFGGNDTIIGNIGNDIFGGDAGNDSLVGDAGADALFGGAGNDSLNGGADGDWLIGGGNNDTIEGEAGDDSMFGDDGADMLIGGGGLNALIGGAGDDTLTGGDDGNWMEGGDDNDQMFGGAGQDSMFGDDGADTLIGGGGLNALIGGAGDDTLNGGDDGNWMEGGDDNDQMFGGAGQDSMFGDEGNDSLIGGGATDALIGGAGDDTLFGDDGADWIEAGADIDSVAGGAGNDTIFGGDGNDVLLDGGSGANQILGGDGNDLIKGGADGDPWLAGEGGDDTIFGGGGADSIVGGAGADLFGFNAVTETGGVILDFVSGTDRLGFATSAFGTIASLVTAAGTPVASGSAPQLLYDTLTGALSYDVDGAGAASAVLMATLRDAPTLVFSDIIPL